MKTMKRTIILLLAGCITSAGMPGYAASANGEQRPDEAAMAADALIARPAGAVITAAGTLTFLLTLPFSAAGGNVKESAERLVVDPAREAFVRCLGCKGLGRYQKPKGRESDD